MTTLKQFVQGVVDGEVVEPFWLSREATKEADMNGRYREVLAFFGQYDTIQMRARLKIELCTEEGCGGLVRAVESRVLGAFRVDACCLKCGGTQTHRAGWLDREARDTFRARIGSKEVG